MKNPLYAFPKGDDLSRKMRQLIPGGAHAYSKAVNQWPYFSPKVLSHGKGAWVWDIDGNRYVDWFSGLTTVSLGHAYQPVLDAVFHQLQNGHNFQLPIELEYHAALTFLDKVAQTDMVKFAKDGSTVNDGAIRLARAFTGRKYIAKCRDHPFFSYSDWFIGKTDCNAGTLPEVAAYTLEFNYNDLDSLAILFATHPQSIAAVILEPVRFTPPNSGFLKGVQTLCQQAGAVFILDEVVTGLKYHLNGAQALFDMEPDLTTWGKGIANGFAISALTGKKAIMSLGDTTQSQENCVFLLSSTHGAEASGLAALIATIEIFSSQDIIAQNYECGHQLRQTCQQILNEFGLDNYITFQGYDCFFTLQFRDITGQESSSFKTLFIQELIRHGILWRGIFYPTLSHQATEREATFKAFHKAAKVYAKALDTGYESFLIGTHFDSILRSS